jgi:TRAP-type C4-dicarboxylate transport system permease small subunit
MTRHASSPEHVARPVRWLLDSSSGLLRIERFAISVLSTLLLVLVLINVVTRYTGFPIYWIDEAAVYSVVWLTFIGASLMTRLRMDFAVTMLTEHLGERGAYWCKVVATGSIAFFGIALLAMCWLWMDPLGILKFGFDAKEFGAQTFNFLYTERTQTLEWPVWVLQTVIPLFAFTLTVHSLANLVEDAGLAPPRPRPPGFEALKSADTVT